MRLLATRLAGMKRESRKKRERCVSHEVVGEEEMRLSMRYYDIDEGAYLAIMRVITCYRANRQSMERLIDRSRGRFNRDQRMIGVPMLCTIMDSPRVSHSTVEWLASKKWDKLIYYILYKN